jgi:hypothetical protein
MHIYYCIFTTVPGVRAFTHYPEENSRARDVSPSHTITHTLSLSPSLSPSLPPILSLPPFLSFSLSPSLHTSPPSLPPALLSLSLSLSVSQGDFTGGSKVSLVDRERGRRDRGRVRISSRGEEKKGEGEEKLFIVGLMF